MALRNMSRRSIIVSAPAQLLLPRIRYTFGGSSDSNPLKSYTLSKCSLPKIICGRIGCTLVSSQMIAICVRLPLDLDFAGTNWMCFFTLHVTTPFCSSSDNREFVSSKLQRRTSWPRPTTLARRHRNHCQEVLASRENVFGPRMWLHGSNIGYEKRPTFY